MCKNVILKVFRMFSAAGNINVNVKTGSVKLASATIGSDTLTSLALTQFESVIINRNRLDRQVGMRLNNSYQSSATPNMAYTSVDTSVDQSITFTLNSSVATDTLILESVVIQVTP
jgi:hypothetical protein